MRALLLAGVVGIGLAAPARADYAFGGSNFNAGQSLTLQFSNGQSTTISTNLFQGWVSDTESNTTGPAGNNNYIVGDVSGAQHNNFFDFSLFGLSANVVSAVLNLQSYYVTGNPTYYLFDVSTPTATLSNLVGPNAAVFADLASGVSYGSFGVSPTNQALNNFTLNSAAVADINAAITSGVGNFNIGGTLSPIAAATAVPEPASLALLAVSAAGVGVFRRRRAA